jgi:hypothetical protein
MVFIKEFSHTWSALNKCFQWTCKNDYFYRNIFASLYLFGVYKECEAAFSCWSVGVLQRKCGPCTAASQENSKVRNNLDPTATNRYKWSSTISILGERRTNFGFIGLRGLRAADCSHWLTFYFPPPPPPPTPKREGPSDLFQESNFYRRKSRIHTTLANCHRCSSDMYFVLFERN